MINLSRNRPLAFLVGGGGFIGSHLTDKLLEKNIQIVAVDNFSTGSRENLEGAAKNNHFHLISESVENLNPADFPKIDYAFIMITPENNFALKAAFDNFLNICEGSKPRIVLVSSIDLYDSSKTDHISMELKDAEKRLAEYAEKNKANARVIRLATVYGSRMRLGQSDPLVRLIEAASKGNLQKESTPLDFTSRDIYIDDAVNLLIKAVMHGSTSHKIYDGALLNPVKTAEIKQVLLDPLWHESKGFVPTELPPWPTPNLVKTMKELSWSPKVSLVNSLKETLKYFNDNPEKVLSKGVGSKQSLRPVGLKVEEESQVARVKWQESSNKSQEEESRLSTLATSDSVKLPKVNRLKGEGIKKIQNWLIITLCLVIILGAIIYPLTTLSLAGWNSRNFISSGGRSYLAGDFMTAESQLEKAGKSYGEIIQITSLGDAISKSGVGRKQWLVLENLQNMGADSIKALSDMVEGTKKLSQALQIISGEKEGSLKVTLGDASASLDASENKLDYVMAKLNDQAFFAEVKDNFNFLSAPIWQIANQGKEMVGRHQQILAGLKEVTEILALMISETGTKSYLVIWQDNRSLRPGGGVINTAAEIVFENGKLREIKEVDLSNTAMAKIEAPVEIRADLKKSSWDFKDTSWDLDYSVGAKTMVWYYAKQTGREVDGVISLDTTAVSKLLETSGSVETSKEGSPISLPNQNQTLKTILNRAFFLPKTNWPEIIRTLNELANQKHLIFYASDQALLSYLNSENLLGLVPRETGDFLAATEANLKEDNLNFELKKEIKLETVMQENGGVNHKLTVKYNLPQGTGTYQGKVKIYLPTGSIAKPNKFSSFSDYGKAGFATYLTIKSGETKELSLEYTEANRVKFQDNKATYDLEIFKQSGTLSDPLSWTVSFPKSWQGDSLEAEKTNNTLIFKSDLSVDRNFKILFKK